jgi:hypothetical protein
MEEPQAKRVRLDTRDVQRTAVPGPEILEDMTLGTARTVVHHMESLQGAYMVRGDAMHTVVTLATDLFTLLFVCMY